MKIDGAAVKLFENFLRHNLITKELIKTSAFKLRISASASRQVDNLGLLRTGIR